MSAHGTHAVSFEADEAFLAAALRPFYVRRGVLLGGALLLFFAVLVARMEATAVRYQAGMGLLTLFLIWRLNRQYRDQVASTLQLWRRQDPSGRTHWLLDDEGLEIRVGESRSRHAWSDLRRLIRRRDAWSLEVAPRMFVHVPPAAASDEALAFLVERCRAAGVRV